MHVVVAHGALQQDADEAALQKKLRLAMRNAGGGGGEKGNRFVVEFIVWCSYLIATDSSTFNTTCHHASGRYLPVRGGEKGTSVCT